ncbi:ParB/RepB/Spo0J family partition protein [Clostridium botulinum]|uniref:ParB/RepB/Spo0J family partition protein n=1 Tax=Clostridium botulinum TaxID=1491 RepID=UPI001FA89E4F|nr:ParB/RepB/Spo0J family partition protein [Clostridium botulinum]
MAKKTLCKEQNFRGDYNNIFSKTMNFIGINCFSDIGRCEKILINDYEVNIGNYFEELAKDIEENGLINPPVVTPEYILIAGERRTKACKFLNYSQIEVRVMTVKDALHQLKLEISENENRKDFSFSEKMQWAEQLKEEYSKIAKENMLKGITLDQNLSKVDSNKQVAKDTGFGSKETYRQAQYIYENGNEDLIQQLDDEKLSINKAYNMLKEQKKQLEEDKDKIICEKETLEKSFNELSEKYDKEKNKEPKDEEKEEVKREQAIEDYENLKKEHEKTCPKCGGIATNLVPNGAGVMEECNWHCEKCGWEEE